MADGTVERDWAALPSDALSVIFEKVGAYSVVLSAQGVCRSWRKLSLEPHVWRCIDVRSTEFLAYDPSPVFDFEKIIADAIRKSKGELASLSIMFSLRLDGIIKLLAESARELKKLRLISCYTGEFDNPTGWYEDFRTLSSSLKELEITDCRFNSVREALEFICGSCAKLESLRLNRAGNPSFSPCNKEAFAIAKTMSELRELHLFGNMLDDVGLNAILDGCPKLESLDLRQCFQLKFDDNLKKKCTRLRILRSPEDSTDDYRHDTYKPIDEQWDDYDHDGGLTDSSSDGYNDYDDFDRYDGYAFELGLI